MQISKETARNIAKKLVANKQAELEKAREMLSQIAYLVFRSRIDKKVLAAYKKYAPYMRDTCSITLHGGGFNSKHVYFPLQGTKRLELPYKGDSQIQPTAEESKKLLPLVNKIEDLEKEIDQLKDQITATLVALRTPKLIQQHFPEAVPHLPAASSPMLPANIPALRKKLASK